MKSENARECPELLGRIMDGVNHLPVNADEILERLVELAKVAVNLDFDKFHVESDLYLAQVKELNLEKEVLDYLKVEIPSQIRMGKVAQNFNELVLAKPVLQSLAEISREAIETYGKQAFINTAKNRLYRAFAFNHIMSGIRFSGTLHLDGNGYVRPNLSGLPLILQKEAIPVFRIRICPVCQRFFWAKRLESPACSETHVNTFNAWKTRIRKSEAELDKEIKNLEKLKSNLSPENSLIRQQNQKVIKLSEKIQRRKKKYGTL